MRIGSVRAVSFTVKRYFDRVPRSVKLHLFRAVCSSQRLALPSHDSELHSSVRYGSFTVVLYLVRFSRSVAILVDLALSEYRLHVHQVVLGFMETLLGDQGVPTDSCS